MLYGMVMTRDGNGAGQNLFGYIRRFEQQAVPKEIRVVTVFGDLLTRTLVASAPRPLSEVIRLYNKKLDAGYHGILRGEVKTIETDLTEKQTVTRMRKLVEALPEGGDLQPYAFADLLSNIGSKASILAAQKLQKAVTSLRSSRPDWGF